jgi:hypothetical protein
MFRDYFTEKKEKLKKLKELQRLRISHRSSKPHWGSSKRLWGSSNQRQNLSERLCTAYGHLWTAQEPRRTAPRPLRAALHSPRAPLNSSETSQNSAKTFQNSSTQPTGTSKQPRNLSECGAFSAETRNADIDDSFILLNVFYSLKILIYTPCFWQCSVLLPGSPLERIFGSSWALFGRSWDLLGTSWAPLRHLCPPLGAPWAPSGNIWPSLIASWVLSGRSWRHKRVLKPPTRPPKTPKASFYSFLTAVSSINTQTAFILAAVVKNQWIKRWVALWPQTSPGSHSPKRWKCLAFGGTHFRFISGYSTVALVLCLLVQAFLIFSFFF